MIHRVTPRGRRAALAVAIAIGAALAAAPLAAQSAPPASLVPPVHSLWFDGGALGSKEIRGGIEGMAFGRFTLGLSVSRAGTAHPRDEFVYPPPYFEGGAYPACEVQSLMLCADSYAYYGGDLPRYRAWTASLDLRLYPSFLAFRNGPARMMVYAGAHLGYRWATWDESVIYYAYPQVYAEGGAGPRPRLSPADSVVVLPPNPYYYPIVSGPTPIHHARGGIEPGLELGVRLLPIGPLFVEVGGRFALVTVDDQMRRTRMGDVESRLVVAGGIAW